MSRAIRRLAALALLVASDVSAAPPCLARVATEPARALVGQQVVHRIEVLRRSDQGQTDFARQPRFPDFRVESLNPRPTADRVRYQGADYLVFETRFALFPLRPGTLEIPAARLACGAHVAEVPASRVEALAVPEAGRPEGFAGLVAPVSVRVRTDRTRIPLGEAVVLTVETRGPGNLWDARVALHADPSIERFPDPPSLDTMRGRRLEVRRIDRIALVPRRVGTIADATVEVVAFDPDGGRFVPNRVALPAIEVAAAERPTAAEPKPPAPAPAEDPAAAPSGERRPLPLAVWAALAGLAVGIGAALVVRRRRPTDAAADAIHHALRDACAAARRGDADAEARALHAGLETVLESRAPGLRTTGLGVLPEDASLRECAEALRALEQARFGSAPRSASDLAAARAALETACAALEAAGAAVDGASPRTAPDS